MLAFFFIEFVFIEPLVQQHISQQKGSVCYAKHTAHDWHLRPIDLPITTMSLPPQALLQAIDLNTADRFPFSDFGQAN